ncbi:MAG TPA: hypothetical protein PLL92_02115, partial [Alicycliphilus sp.]|nr:hypothetical protein [Alicycliphilus sp.]
MRARPTVADIGKAASVDDAIAVAEQAVATPPMPASTRAAPLDEADLLRRAMAGIPMDAAPAAVDGAIAQATAATTTPGAAPIEAATPQARPEQPAQPAMPAAQDSSQPAKLWFGRRGDGYAEPQDAERAMNERKRLQPQLDWAVERMPDGRYRLAGYVPLAAQERAQAPMTAPVTATQPLGTQPTAHAALPQATPAAPPAAPVEQQINVQLGRDQIPLSDGGKPFATQEAARAAKSAQPMMRVVRVKGGFALADKTPAQLAAQQKAAARLSSAQTSARGEPIPAHAFLSAAGGLNRSTAADLGLDGNPRMGNRFLFAGAGRGLSMEQAREQLVQAGYLGADATLNDAYALIKLSLSRPQYTPEGVERMAQAESRARFEDYLAAQQEAARQADEDFDPFAPGQDTGLPDGFTADDLREVGYTEADTPLKSEVRALVEQAKAHGIDTDDLLAEVFEDTRYDPNPDAYYERARDELRRAIAESTGGRSHQEAAGHVQGRPGQEAQRGSDSDVRQADGAEGAPGADRKSSKPVNEDLLGEAPSTSQQQAADARAAQVRKEQQQRNAAPSADEFTLGMEDARTGREVDPNQQELLAPLDENDQAGRTTTRAQQVARNVAEAVDKGQPGPARRMKLLRDEAQRLDATADGQGQLPDLQATNRQAADMLREAAAESEAQAWSDAGLRFSRAKKADGERMHLDELRAQLDGMGVDNTISERDGVLTISKIVVPQDKRSAGLGSQAMQSIVEYADANGLHIALTPSADFGGNKARLTQFYKRFGFKENKGRAKVYEVSESMVRENPGGRVLFSRSASTKAAYEARIDALYEGAKPNAQGVRVLDRSDMLALLGLGAGPVHIVEGKVDQGRFNHGLTAADWKKVPEWLDNPAAVFDSDTQPGRLVFMAPELVRGQPVRMIVDPRPDGKGVNLLVNAYDAERNPFQRWEREGLLRYFDQQKAPSIFGTFQPRLTGLPGDKGRRKNAPSFTGSFQPRLAGLPGDQGRGKILTQKHLAGYRRANDPQYSFAGQQAATADTMALATAQERLESDEDAETIRKETGWHKGADGKWRFEISDADAVLMADTSGSEGRRSIGQMFRPFDYEDMGGLTVGRMLHHPALFAAYPEIANIRVEMAADVTGAGYRGGYSVANGRITINRDLSWREAMSTLLHEIQHGIQEVEGFATGSNPSRETDVSEFSEESRKHMQQLVHVDELAREHQVKPTSFVELAGYPDNVVATVKRWAEAGQWESNIAAIKRDLLTAREKYRRSAGEAEARNTQARQKMTDEERRATPPSSTQDVADADVIVTFNGKEMHSAPAPANAAPASTAQPAKTGATVSGIAAAIRKAYGNVLGQLQVKGIVTLTQSQDEAIEAAAKARADKTGQPLVQVREQLLASVRNNVDLDIKRSADGAIQGFYDPQSGQSFLIADGLTDQAAPGVLVHEVGVHMARDTQDARGKEAFDKMIHRAEVLRRMGRGNPFFARVTQRMRDAGETSREEAAAYIAEEYERDRVNAPASVKRWVTDFMAAVRAWLFGKGVLVKASDLSAADIAAIARANVRREANDSQAMAGDGAVRRSGASPTEDEVRAMVHQYASTAGAPTEAQMREAVRQYRDTERAYGGKPAYDKAKAAGRTKLTYGQWVQVRTENFRNWFGDWQSVSAQERLDAIEPIKVRAPDEWKDLPVDALRQRVDDSLLQLMESGEPLHHPEVGDVSVVRKGIKKALASSADPAKLRVLG